MFLRRFPLFNPWGGSGGGRAGSIPGNKGFNYELFEGMPGLAPSGNTDVNANNYMVAEWDDIGLDASGLTWKLLNPLPAGSRVQITIDFSFPVGSVGADWANLPYVDLYDAVGSGMYVTFPGSGTAAALSGESSCFGTTGIINVGTDLSTYCEFLMTMRNPSVTNNFGSGGIKAFIQLSQLS